MGKHNLDDIYEDMNDDGKEKRPPKRPEGVRNLENELDPDVQEHRESLIDDRVKTMREAADGKGFSEPVVDAFESHLRRGLDLKTTKDLNIEAEKSISDLAFIEGFIALKDGLAGGKEEIDKVNDFYPSMAESSDERIIRILKDGR